MFGVMAEHLDDPDYVPAWMVGHDRLIATYKRIAARVRDNELLAEEKRKALEWCRANGNPHQEQSQ